MKLGSDGLGQYRQRRRAYPFDECQQDIPANDFAKRPIGRS
jgi:hypothetical protein